MEKNEMGAAPDLLSIVFIAEEEGPVIFNFFSPLYLLI